jgi:hypothetical protein
MRKILLLSGIIMFCFAQPFNNDDPRAIIEKVKIYRLTQELDLTTEQAVVFFPKLNELQKIERDFNTGKIRIINQLKTMLQNNASEQELLEEIAEFEKINKERLTKRMSKIKEMWKILTPIQRAKYLIFEEEFNNEIREMIKKVKKQREP